LQVSDRWKGNSESTIMLVMRSTPILSLSIDHTPPCPKPQLTLDREAIVALVNRRGQWWLEGGTSAIVYPDPGTLPEWRKIVGLQSSQ
jgi:hypothetical protein